MLPSALRPSISHSQIWSFGRTSPLPPALWRSPRPEAAAAAAAGGSERFPSPVINKGAFRAHLTQRTSSSPSTLSSQMSRQALVRDMQSGGVGGTSQQTRGAAGGQSSTAGPHEISVPTPTVDASWLLENLGSVKVLDASWYMPAEKRNPFQEFQAGRIPGAQFFDVNAISDPTSKLPHMLPTATAFSRAASALGLSNSDSIVVYDGKGLFSAARAWWMFRVFGHDAVAVLEGGLPHWKAKGFPVESAPEAEAELRHKASLAAVAESYGEAAGPGEGNLGFIAHLRPDLLLSMGQVLDNIERKQFQLVDARAAGRVEGTAPEPRPGMSSGSVPGSFNVPFPKVLDAEGCLLCPVELESVFKGAGVDLDSNNLAVSCGTGVTACILALAFYRLGNKTVPVYDGSWTEWASTEGSPISKKGETSTAV